MDKLAATGWTKPICSVFLTGVSPSRCSLFAHQSSIFVHCPFRARNTNFYPEAVMLGFYSRHYYNRSLLEKLSLFGLSSFVFYRNKNMAKTTTEQEFGKVRSLLWPIHSYELKKLIPMAIMAFFISFNYTVVRDTKDALIMTSAGAETLPWLKTIGTVPGAIIFMIIYLKLSNVLSREKLFYAAMVPFLVFFALFPTVIYPYREVIQPTSAPWLESVLPLGWHGLIGMYKNWTYSLFYIMAELWGSAVLSLCSGVLLTRSLVQPKRSVSIACLELPSTLL